MSQPTLPPRTFTKAIHIFKRAWREEIKRHHPKWKEATIQRSLAYLWASRTQNEEDECQRLVDTQSTNLPMIDQSILPTHPVPKKWLPHIRARARTDGVVESSNPGSGSSGQPPNQSDHADELPARKRINTTNFSHWPQNHDNDVLLPEYVDGRLTEAELDNLVDHGTQMTSPTHREESWHAVRELGQGSHGRAMLWVQVDENQTITRRLAIKDTEPMASRARWANPLEWRDNLPQELAIEQRLDAQKSGNINKFHGYRLNMKEMRYRMYHDVCDYGDLQSALHYYTIMHKSFPWTAGGAPKDFIPESFLWYVFRCLVDALLVMKKGNMDESGEYQPWKEIVHMDLCPANIFVAAPLDEDGRPNYKAFDDSIFPMRDGSALQEADRTKWPQIKIADFDSSFFELQDGDDTYQDNPFHYHIKDKPQEDDEPEGKVDGRYPPESFSNFWKTVYESKELPVTRDFTAGEDVKITNASDVWQLGQTMWALINNLRHGGDFRVHFDAEDRAPKRFLVDPELTPYSRGTLDSAIFTGEYPNRITHKYSEKLRSLVKDCLAYEPADRIKIEDLSTQIDKARAELTLDHGEKEVVKLFLPDGSREAKIGNAYEGQKKRKRGD
ncbi:hypothetical protein ACN47E_004500 [Coniothyrium glycines]